MALPWPTRRIAKVGWRMCSRSWRRWPATSPPTRRSQSVLDAVRWHAQHLRVAPAEEALRDVVRRPYRDDPQAAVGRLAALDMHDLPDQLARRVFGRWSSHRLKLVRQSGMHQPRRYSPAISRGVIF